MADPRLIELIRPHLEKARQAGYDAGYAEASRRLLEVVPTMAQPISKSFRTKKYTPTKPITKAKKPAEPGSDDPHGVLLAAMLQHAAECAETGEDPGEMLDWLADLAHDPERMADVLSGAGSSAVKCIGLLILKGKWDEGKHPRGKNGRFLSKDRIQAAATDPKVKAELEKEVRPEDADKLKAAIEDQGGTIGRTKRGEAKYQAGQRRAARKLALGEARKIADRIAGGEGTVEDVDTLASHLKAGLTRDHIRLLQSYVGGGGRRKADMVTTLLDAARDAVTAKKEPEADQVEDPTPETAEPVAAEVQTPDADTPAPSPEATAPEPVASAPAPSPEPEAAPVANAEPATNEAGKVPAAANHREMIGKVTAAMQSGSQWHANTEMPNGKNGKQVVDEIMRGGNSRWALPKTITEQGWATDTKFAMKATPQMVEHAKAKGVDQIEGRTPNIASILPKGKGDPATIIGGRVNENGKHVSLMQSEDGTQAQVDSNYVAHIKKTYPDAEFEINGRMVIAKQDGETIGLIMPMGDVVTPRDEAKNPGSLKKVGTDRHSIADVAEPGPYTADDVTENGSYLVVGKDTPNQAQVRITGSANARYSILGGGVDSPSYRTLTQAKAAAKELLAHAHGMTDDGDLIFYPKGAITAKLEGPAKTKKDYYDALKAKAKANPVKKTTDEIEDDAGVKHTRELLHVGDNFAVHEALPDDKGKVKGYTVTHTGSGVAAETFNKRDDALRFAHILQNMPETDWNSFSNDLKENDPAKFKQIIDKFRNVKNAFMDDEYHPDMGTADVLSGSKPKQPAPDQEPVAPAPAPVVEDDDAPIQLGAPEPAAQPAPAQAPAPTSQPTKSQSTAGTEPVPPGMAEHLGNMGDRKFFRDDKGDVYSLGKGDTRPRLWDRKADWEQSEYSGALAGGHQSLEDYRKSQRGQFSADATHGNRLLSVVDPVSGNTPIKDISDALSGLTKEQVSKVIQSLADSGKFRLWADDDRLKDDPTAMQIGGQYYSTVDVDKSTTAADIDAAVQRVTGQAPSPAQAPTPTPQVTPAPASQSASKSITPQVDRAVSEWQDTSKPLSDRLESLAEVDYNVLDAVNQSEWTGKHGHPLHNELFRQIHKAHRNFAKGGPFGEAPDEQDKQEFADHLADIGKQSSRYIQGLRNLADAGASVKDYGGNTIGPDQLRAAADLYEKHVPEAMAAIRKEYGLPDGKATKPVAAAGGNPQPVSSSGGPDEPKEGDRNADGLVLRNGRWQREGEDTATISAGSKKKDEVTNGQNAPQTASTGTGDATTQSGTNRPGSDAGGAAKPESGQASFRPRIVTARAEHTKAGNPELLPKSVAPHLSPEQVQGAALAVEAMDKHGGFLNNDGTGVGKAQPLDAKILTPFGWRYMGSIKVGDSVIAGDGSVTEVIGVYPQGMQPVYRLKFSDGSSAECTKEHLWATKTWDDRRNESRLLPRKWRVQELQEIAATLKHRGGQSNHSIPIVSPVSFPSRNVSIDPYLMGVLLGDGGLSRPASVTVTTADDEIYQEVATRLPQGVKISRQFGLSFSIAKSSGSRNLPNKLLQSLRNYGIHGVGKTASTKFVPEDYKINSVEVRLAVLRGLMDTDGTVNKNGTSCQFYSTSFRLAEDVVFLVRSLGGTTRMSIKEPKYHYNGKHLTGKTCYVVTVTMPSDINPFLLSRKANKVVSKTKYKPARYLVEVEEVGRKECQCIAVAHTSHLYVTDDFIVTHNTRQQLAVAKTYADRGKKVLIIAPKGVTKADFKKGTIAGSFKDDSAAMGIPLSLTKGDSPLKPGQVAVSTYENLKSLKDHIDDDTVVLFDESHYMKNPTSARSKQGREIADKAGAVMYASATPADKATHIEHLIRAGVFGTQGKTKTFQKLGMELHDQHVGGGQYRKVWRVKPGVKKSEVARRLSGLFDQMSKDGLMVKRELSMDGVGFNTDHIQLSPEQHDEMKKVYDDVLHTTDGNKAIALMAARMHQEHMKIPHTVAAIQRDLAAGRSPVIFAGRVNDVGDEDEDETTDDVKQALKASGHSSQGTIPALKAALIAAGIPEDQIAELHGAASEKPEKAMQRFQDGKAKIMLATIQSGGTGINLDDTVGNRPRSVHIMTPPLTANDMAQAIGRVHRKNTKSPSNIHAILSDTAIDQWNAGILHDKFRTLGAVSGGQITRGADVLGPTDTPELPDETPYDWGQSLLDTRHYADTPAYHNELIRDFGGERVKRGDNWTTAFPSPQHYEQYRNEVAKRDAANRAKKEQEAQSAASRPPAHHGGRGHSFTQLKNGNWGARVEGNSNEGDTATLTKRNGDKSNVKLGRVVWRGNGVTLHELA